jgi:hypothetical protein
MVIKVQYPLSITADANTALAMQIGYKEALTSLKDQLGSLEEESAVALAQVNDLLNDGFTMIFRERVQTAQGESLLMFFHKQPTPLETVEQSAIKDAIRLYNNPPAMEGAGEHPDTIRLRAVMERLFKTGLYPETLDDTQKIPALNIEEVEW